MPHISFDRLAWVAGRANDPGGALGHWAVPGSPVNPGALGIECSPLGQNAQRGGTGGWAFIVHDNLEPGMDIPLGQNPRAAVTQAVRNAIEVRLGLPSGTIQSNRLHNIIWELLTDHADPTGQTRAKPLIPASSARGLELWLPGFGLVRQEAFEFGRHAHSQQVLDTLRNDYALALDNMPDESLAALIGAWQRKYGEAARDHRLFVAPGRRDVGTRRPGTSFTDAFTQADNGLSANWATDEASFVTVSNQVRGGSAASDNNARYVGGDLGSEDHIVDLRIAVQDTSTYNGPTARKADSTALTFYTTLIFGSTAQRMWRRVTGTFTEIGTSDAITHANGDIYRIRCAGSTITHYQNAVQVGSSRTDTNITGNLTGGMHSNPTTDARLDDWVMDDEIAAASSLIQGAMPRGLQTGLRRGTV